jgi:(2Fe-2S) ferredoxin
MEMLYCESQNPLLQPYVTAKIYRYKELSRPSVVVKSIVKRPVENGRKVNSEIYFRFPVVKMIRIVTY